MIGKCPNSSEASWLGAVLAVVMIAACAVSRTPGSPGARPAPARSTQNSAAAKANDTTDQPLATASATPESSPELANDTDHTAPAVASTGVMPDVDYWPTPQPVVDRMLELARVRAPDLVYDLGCGDARSLVTAAERYGATGVGFDVDPRLVAQARENARRHGVDKLVRIEQADIFTVDLSPASVVFLYLTPRLIWRLVPALEKLRRGSRIVAHEYAVPGARPARIVELRGPPDGPPGTDEQTSTTMHKIYLWKMPWQRQPTDWDTGN